ncbi:MAG TPA: DUF3618 domain-containing protein [Bryobacteraceae bacterium]
MGETTQQIEAHIENTREALGSNLHELEDKVKSLADWKYHFQTKPMTMLGVAFGGGVLIATMLGGRKPRRRHSNNVSNSEPHAVTAYQKNKAVETWDNIKGALIGVAATRFKDFVGDVVPGFDAQYQRVEQKAKALP